MGWKDEFPDFDVPAQVIEFLTEAGFEDSSWHNDVGPSFRLSLPDLLLNPMKLDPVEAPEIVFWSDHEHKDKREMGQEHRFAVVVNPIGTSYVGSDDGLMDTVEVFATNDALLACHMATWLVRLIKTGFKELQGLADAHPKLKDMSDVDGVCDANMMGDMDEACNYFGEMYPSKEGEEPPIFKYNGPLKEACHRLFNLWLQRRQAMPKAPPRPTAITQTLTFTVKLDLVVDNELGASGIEAVAHHLANMILFNRRLQDWSRKSIDAMIFTGAGGPFAKVDGATGSIKSGPALSVR